MSRDPPGAPRQRFRRIAIGASLLLTSITRPRYSTWAYKTFQESTYRTRRPNRSGLGARQHNIMPLCRLAQPSARETNTLPTKQANAVL